MGKTIEIIPLLPCLAATLDHPPISYVFVIYYVNCFCIITIIIYYIDPFHINNSTPSTYRCSDTLLSRSGYLTTSSLALDPFLLCPLPTHITHSEMLGTIVSCSRPQAIKILKMHIISSFYNYSLKMQRKKNLNLVLPKYQ